MSRNITRLWRSGENTAGAGPTNVPVYMHEPHTKLLKTPGFTEQPESLTVQLSSSALGYQ